MLGSEGCSPRDNGILASLGLAEQKRIFPHLHPVEMPLGKVLKESGDALRYVYFPADCIVSLLYVLESGASAEISVVGNEGLIGIALFMGGDHAESRYRTERRERLSALRSGAQGRISL
jgi:hypothetical protein